MKLFNKYLNELVEIHRDSDSFEVGYIIDLNDDFYLAIHLSDTGHYDGYCISNNRDVLYLNVNSQYLNNLQQVNREIPKLNLKANYESFYKLAYDTHRLVNIEVDNTLKWDFKGYIKEIDEDIVVFNAVDSYGNSDGEISCMKDMITGIEIDSLELIIIEDKLKDKVH